ncbi:MAG TPA: acylphosphatase [Verrucomicrobiales bacterium]|nr:acylphosphatase [Verrucomicrobiales bacterium]
MVSAKRESVRVLYTGRVQGVGFRYMAKTVAQGYEVTGQVRNLPDGRVELLAEGGREELDAFLQAIRDSGLGPCIRQEDLSWDACGVHFKGFEIVR